MLLRIFKQKNKMFPQGTKEKGIMPLDGIPMDYCNTNKRCKQSSNNKINAFLISDAHFTKESFIKFKG